MTNKEINNEVRQARISIIAERIKARIDAKQKARLDYFTPTMIMIKDFIKN